MICSKCGNNEELSKESYIEIMNDLTKSASPLEMARHAQACPVCSMVLNSANAIVTKHMQESQFKA